MTAVNIYTQGLMNAWNGHISLLSDKLNMALLGNGYTPNLATDAHWSDVSANEITGTGYTAGGEQLTAVTWASTSAANWSHTWAASTGYTYGQIVAPPTSTGYLYRCVVAGTSGTAAPTFPTVVGETVTDNTVTWACVGESVEIFSSADVTWTTATFTAYYAVIYDAQSGTPSAEPLIMLINFGAAQSPSGVNFTIAPDPTLGWFVFTPPA